MASTGRFGYILDVVSGKAVAGTAAFTNSLKGMSKEAGTLGSAFGGMKAKIAGAILAFLSIRTVSNLIKESVQESSKAAEAMTKLRSKYGDAATGLADYAATLQKKTRFEDDSIVAAQASLGFYNLSSEAVKGLTPAILDMAEALGGDLTGGANLVGRAMSGNATMLSRYGIMLSDAQKKTMQTGTESERAAVMVEALGKKFGGLAEAIGGTTLGRWAQFNNAIGDLKETFGDVITQSSTAAKLLEKITEKITEINGADTSNLAFAFDEMVKGTVNLAVTLAESSDGVINLIKGFKSLVQIVSTFMWGIQGPNLGKIGTWGPELIEQMKQFDAAGRGDIGARVAAQIKSIQSALAEIPSGTRTPGVNGKGGGGKGGGLGALGGSDKEAEAESKKQAEIYKEWMGKAAQYRYDFNEEDLKIFKESEEKKTEISKTEALNRIDYYLAEQALADEKRQASMEAFSEYAGNLMSYPAHAFSTMLAESLVDGKKDFKELWNAALKGAIAMTAQLLLMLGIMKLIHAVAGAIWGTAVGGPVGGALGAIGAGVGGPGFHSGGYVGRLPRAHGGRMASNELAMVLQRGEAVTPSFAVNRQTRPTLDFIRQTGRAPGGNTYDFSGTQIHVHGVQDPKRIVDDIWSGLQNKIRGETERGERFIHKRGIYG